MPTEINDETANSIDEQLPLGADSHSPADQMDPGTDDTVRRKARKASSKSAKARAAGEHKEEAPGAAPPSLRDRLLATITLPLIKLDKKTLPSELHEALDAANLADAQNLTTALFATLTAMVAVAGPGIKCTSEKPLPGLNTPVGLALRLAIITEQQATHIVPPCIVGAVYAAESDALDAYTAELQQTDQARRARAQRYRIREQAAQAGIELAADPSSADDVSRMPRPRPRIVLPNGAAGAILGAAAGGTGILVVDGRRLPWLANVGENFDVLTDDLLNTAAAGFLVPIANPTSGHVQMRSFPASAIGAINLHKCESLSHANRAQLSGTIFMPAAAPPPTGDYSKLNSLMRRVRKLGLEDGQLRLRGDAFASAAQAWTTAAADLQPPLADYIAGAPDLARRLAVALHLPVLDGSAAACTIPAKTMVNAIRIVEEVVLPFASALLQPSSTSQVERDARRIIAYLQTHTSLVDRVFERRALLRAWQRTMTAVRLDHALALLVEAELLTDMDGGGRAFEVAPAMFGGK